MMFFENEEISQQLTQARAALTFKDYGEFKNTFNLPGVNKLFFKMLQDIITTITCIQENPSHWDKRFQLSIEAFGSKFIETLNLISGELINNGKLNNIRESYLTHIENLYLHCLYFTYEADFNSDSNNRLKHTALYPVMYNVESILNDGFLSSDSRDNINKTLSFAPYNLLKKLYHSADMKNLVNFDEKHNDVNILMTKIDNKSNEVDKKISDFQTELEEKETIVTSLKETLDKHETAFNFVGLYDGFNKLLKTKILESRILLGSLVTMGIIMIVPLLCTIFGWLPENILKDEEAISHLLKLVPFISLEVLLIYFFRVILQSYKSVKAQILQIELRQTLCQFIQNYADYSKDIKKDDPAVLEKFENLIFSGIISDAENLPSTFDGMDQIGKLFSTLKGKG
ncbi:hypothetical protein HJP15_07540 [Pseudoalteromonas sp. NEC-BIFX-2020_002]|uniref:hypothetical protein n=1 Tax=Pseudoalteromonas sp. NEC-BIFX-2020_002 TaxID=2732353 RepID=UPI001476D17B|nr:hypothetical protein [Pseudoalteromonas sp. NEC-BIFX-2020_002]NNG42771.1 hypothetical protein [Pseudoalteromonas sp. NEC-BIFX-2020_002]